MPYPVAAVRGKNFGNPGYFGKVTSTAAANLIAYWPLDEASGSVATDYSGNGYNGAYTGVTPGQTGIGDGRTCPLFDGANDYMDAYSAGFAGAFNGAEGTLMVWAKVSGAGVWTDSKVGTIVRWAVDDDNRIWIRKSNNNNELDWVYLAGATQERILSTAYAVTTWQCIALTWSASGDAMKAYINGAQVGSTRTTLGTWAGAFVSPTTNIGCHNLQPGIVELWSGYLAHVAVWTTPLTAAQILALATV